MAEKRRHERFEMAGFVTYRPGVLSGRVDAVTKNVSLRGACFFSEKKLQKGKIVWLKLYYGSKSGARKIKAKIAYSTPVEDKLGRGYFNGVEFLD
ncbi:PilZ domain-containing protein [Thermoproteota archaeon]